MFFLFYIYTSDFEHCSGINDDDYLLSSGTENQDNIDANLNLELDRLRRLKARLVERRAECEHLRNLSFIQMRANPVGREHARFFNMYRSINRQITDFLRQERTVSQQIRRAVNQIRRNR